MTDVNYQGSFRNFCMDMWYEHKDELLLWEKKLPQYDSAYYFRQHRWFLKNLYKMRTQINNTGEQ